MPHPRRTRARVGRAVSAFAALAFVAGFGLGGTAAKLLAPWLGETRLSSPGVGSPVVHDTAAEAGVIDVPHAPRAPVPVALSAPGADDPRPAPTLVPGSPVRELAPTPAPVVAAPPLPLADEEEHVVTVRRGDTLLDILTRAGVQLAEAHAAIDRLREAFDPRRLKVGQEIELTFSTDDVGVRQLASLALDTNNAADLQLRRDEAGAFTVDTFERPRTRETALAAGDIDGSLYETARRAGLPVALLTEMIKLFSWDVDFQRDLHPGDRFEALYEWSGDEAAGARGLLYAALHLRGQLLHAYRFERGDGSVEYLDEAGRPLRKSLLRTPVDGARLSSRFGPRRHPVLGFTRMHKGIDFAASTGTPVFAAGDGTIEVIGRNKGHGKYIRLKHNGEYATAYAHLSRFANGLARGSRVRQGQVIGHVGSTGLSTGPHLHYEVLRNGTPINPLAVEQVVADSLSGDDLRRFRQLRAELDARRDALERDQLVAQSGG